jgi:pyruvate kinase
LSRTPWKPSSAPGMDVARLNFSHGDQALRTENIARIRAAADKVGKLAGILADLQGPKLRVGEMIDSASRIRAMTSS